MRRRCDCRRSPHRHRCPLRQTLALLQASEGRAVRSADDAFRAELVRPYRRWLLIVLAAMLIETLMSLAAPWPLARAGRCARRSQAAGGARMGARVRLPAARWACALRQHDDRHRRLQRSRTYIDNYFTERWPVRGQRSSDPIYEHLHRLSLAFTTARRPARCSPRHQRRATGNFASASTLRHSRRP